MNKEDQMKNRKVFNPSTIYLIYTGISAFLFILMKNVREIYRYEVALLDPFQLVIVGTMMEVTAFLFEIPTGIVADRFSRKLSVIIGILLISVGFLLEGFLPFFLVILISQFFLGLGQTFTSGADEAWIADEVKGENLEVIFLKGAQVGQVLSIVGIIISTFLGTFYVNLPFLVGGVAFVLLAIFLIRYMTESEFDKGDEEIHSLKHMVESVKVDVHSIKKKPVLLLFVWITLFYGLYSEGFDRLWTAHFLEDIKLPSFSNSVFWMGFINLLAMISSIVAVEIIKRRLVKTGKLQKVWLLLIINLLMILTLFLFAITRQFVLASGLFISFNIVRRINQPVYRAWLNQHIESRIRATVLSAYGQLDSLGQIIGGPILGYVALKTSVSFGIGVAAVILSPVLILYLVFIRKVSLDDQIVY
jgi:MFS transporter, DHA3 family, tetracycline resistance protein